MATMGQLQPGWSGTYWLPRTFAKIDAGSEADSDAGNGILSIHLRAKAGRLIISWRSRTTGAETDTMSDSAETDTGTEAGTTDAGTMSDSAGIDEGIDEDMTKIVIPVELVRHLDGSYRFYFRCPGPDTGTGGGADDKAGTGIEASSRRDDIPGDSRETNEGDPNDARRACGRRVLKLHFVRQSETGRYRFLCQRCSGLRYAGPFENPRQRALRRANKLWRRLAGTEDAVEAVQLLAKALQAETQATEAHTAQLQRLIAWLDNRRGPQFTL
jgi:hypothetical protein